VTTKPPSQQTTISTPIPLFTIEEEEDDDTSSTSSTISAQISNLNEWKSDPNNFITEAKLLTENNNSITGFLVVSLDYIIWLKIHPDNSNLLILQTKLELGILKKITHKKKDPNFLTFQYENFSQHFFAKQPLLKITWMNPLSLLQLKHHQ